MDDDACPDRRTLTAFLDGELPERKAAGVSDHMAECGICYDTIAAAVRAQRDAPPPESPLLPAFATAIAFALGLTLALWLVLARLS